MNIRPLALTLTLFAPCSAHALDPGVRVYGACHTSLGNMASPNGINEAQIAILEALKGATAVIQGGLLEQIAAEKNLTNQLNQSQADFARQLAASESETRALEQTAGVNQPDDICDQAARRAKIAQGLMASKTLRTQMSGNLKTWNKKGGSGGGGTGGSGSTTVKTEKMIAALPPEQVNAKALFDPEHTTSSTSDANTYIAVLTAPEPPKELIGSQKDTPAGKESVLSQRVWSLTTGAAQNALVHISTEHQAVIDGAPLVTMWNDSGQQGHPPGYNTATGKISPSGARYVHSITRYANPKWFEHLAQTGESGVLREQTLMMATEIAQYQAQLTLLEHLTTVTASAYAARNNQDSMRVLAQESATDSGLKSRGIQ